MSSDVVDDGPWSAMCGGRRRIVAMVHCYLVHIISLRLSFSLHPSIPPSLRHALSELRVEDKSMETASELVLLRRGTDL